MYEFTICFIKRGNEVLLLNRDKPCWMGRWNGIGGKLEKDESPKECMLREIKEETGIDIGKVNYKGNVTWITDVTSKGGMYAFTAELPLDYIYETPVKIDEGILDWKEISWILDPSNDGIAENVPSFLPLMLNEDKLYEHKCTFEGSNMIDFVAVTLNENLSTE